MWKRMMSVATLVTALVIVGGCATAPSSPEGRVELNRDVDTALTKAKVQDPSLQAFLDKAYGYAIFPSVGKGAVGVGGAYGKGEVFERSKQIGYCDLSQATIGIALGGQTFTEIIAFETKAAQDGRKRERELHRRRQRAHGQRTGPDGRGGDRGPDLLVPATLIPECTVYGGSLHRGPSATGAPADAARRVGRKGEPGPPGLRSPDAPGQCRAAAGLRSAPRIRRELPPQR
jgi:hypothetical protein